MATQQANRAHDRERELRQHQHQHVRDGWLEANAHLGPQYRQVVRTLAWQRRATGLAIEQQRPAMSWRPSARCPSRPGASEPGAKPPPNVGRLASRQTNRIRECTLWPERLDEARQWIETFRMWERRVDGLDRHVSTRAGRRA